MVTSRGTEDSRSPEQALVVAKLLTAGFAGGLVAISAVAVVFSGGGGAVGGGGSGGGGSGNPLPGAGGLPLDVLLTGIGAVLLFGAVTLGVVTRPVFLRMARRQALDAADAEGGEANLAGAFLGWVLIRGATIEGAGLLGAVAAIVSGSLWALALPAVAIVLLLISVPSRSMFGRFVDDALAEM